MKIQTVIQVTVASLVFGFIRMISETFATVSQLFGNTAFAWVVSSIIVAIYLYVLYKAGTGFINVLKRVGTTSTRERVDVEREAKRHENFNDDIERVRDSVPILNEGSG